MRILTSFISVFSNCRLIFRFLLLISFGPCHSGADDTTCVMMFMQLLLLCLGHCLPGADSQAITAHIGDTVMLPCDGPADTDTKEVDVLWLFGGKPACWFNGNWCETGHYVSRTRLGSIKQNNFSLVITGVRKDDDGVYMCRISHENRQTIRLHVKGDGKQVEAETPPRDIICRPHREREDPPERRTSSQGLLTSGDSSSEVSRWKSMDVMRSLEREGNNNEKLRWEQVLGAVLKAGTGVFYLICTIIAIQLHWSTY
ncbi:uncharacterized protein LOC125740827 isoform X3 [Brienomyrus brachyistius]|uniref:uncharacterized protein LOC125740827 isoform X3 n=1 Tax=Brienomyrus brachyistius TaxID=42636 RepID=UPI0020B23F34|nr:uncharacterized protein LOC125740827 isoform X3 [Brienomyrus brachyistius]